MLNGGMLNVKRISVSDDHRKEISFSNVKKKNLAKHINNNKKLQNIRNIFSVFWNKSSPAEPDDPDYILK